jgi:hypothetical protein
MRSLIALLKSPVSIIVFCFVLLNFIHLVFVENGSNEQLSLILTRIQYFILSLIIFFALTQVSPIYIGRLLVSIAILLVLLQGADFLFSWLIVPIGTEGMIPGRAGSTFINPNKVSEVIVLLGVLGMAAIQPRWRFLFLVFLLVGVFFSFSRSGLIAIFIVALLGFYFRLYSSSSYLLALLLIFSGFVGFSIIIDFVLSDIDAAAYNNILNRLMFSSTHDVSDSSTEVRFHALMDGFNLFLSSPVFGAGAGYTSFWGYLDVSTHNQNVLILSEYGLVGYALFVGLIALGWRGGSYFFGVDMPKGRRLLLVVFLFYTIFTHNMFDDLYWMLSIFILLFASGWWCQWPRSIELK